MRWLSHEMKLVTDLSVSLIHANMCLTEREVIIKEFDYGSTQVLVTTDVFSRMMVRIATKLLVINYDFPMSARKL